MWIEYTKNGKYKFVEQYKDDLGKYKKVSVTFDKNTNSTRKQAIKLLSEKIARNQNNKIIDLTLHQALDMFYDYKKNSNLKQGTIMGNYYNIIQIKKHSEDILLKNLNLAYCDNILKHLPMVSSKRFKEFLKWIYKKEYYNKDLFSKVDIVNDVKPRDRKLYLEKEDVYERIEKLNSYNTYNCKLLAYIIEFITLTGLRIGEVLALEYNDITIENKYSILHITKNYDSLNNIITTPKTKTSIRDISLNSRASQIIKETKMLKRIYGIESNIIFCNTNGSLTCYSTLTTACKNHGVPTGFHIYRHTHASLLAEQGVPIETIQRRMGHENDKITKEIYIHVTKNTREKEIKLFSELNIL